MDNTRVLVISGHPDLNDSVANKTVMEALEAKLPGAQFDYLDRLYGKDFQIDTAAEQAKLVAADAIVLQFPIFWYGMPSLLSRWMEQTFTHGFSHGSTGNKLHGKKLIASFTTGAPESLYHKDAFMGYEIEEFLPPILATCHLCGLEFAGYVYTGGVSYQNRTDAAALADMKARAISHADRVVALIQQ